MTTKRNEMDVYEKEKVMLSVLSLTQKKIDEAYELGKKEAQDEIDELGNYISELEAEIKEKDEAMQLLNDKIIYLLDKHGGKW